MKLNKKENNLFLSAKILNHKTYINKLKLKDCKKKQKIDKDSMKNYNKRIKRLKMKKKICKNKNKS